MAEGDVTFAAQQIPWLDISLYSLNLSDGLLFEHIEMDWKLGDEGKLDRNLNDHIISIPEKNEEDSFG